MDKQFDLLKIFVSLSKEIRLQAKPELLDFLFFDDNDKSNLATFEQAEMYRDDVDQLTYAYLGEDNRMSSDCTFLYIKDVTVMDTSVIVGDSYPVRHLRAMY